MDDDVENDGKSGKKNTIIIIKSVVYIVKHFRQTKEKRKKKYALCSSYNKSAPRKTHHERLVKRVEHL